MTDKELQKPKLNPIAKKMFPSAQSQVNEGRCPICGNKINGPDDFKDELSIKEYSISGMCMKCQDSTFG